MEKFNIAYRTTSGEVFYILEEYEDINSAISEKTAMLNFDNLKPDSYYVFNLNDGSICFLNPRSIESIRVIGYEDVNISESV